MAKGLIITAAKVAVVGLVLEPVPVAAEREPALLKGDHETRSLDLGN